MSTTDSTEETVEVRIEVEERVTYSRFVTMPRSVFETLSSRLDRRDARIEEEINELYIDPVRDWMDSNDTEVTVFQIEEQSNG